LFFYPGQLDGERCSVSRRKLDHMESANCSVKRDGGDNRSCIGTVIIYYIVEKTVGFRIDEEGEQEGLDKSLHGEHGYGLVNSGII